MVPSSEGDRTVDCSTYVRTDLIMHRVLTRQSPLRMRIEASVRALVVAVLRGRSAATSALDNLGLLIEGLSLCFKHGEFWVVSLLGVGKMRGVRCQRVGGRKWSKRSNWLRQARFAPTRSAAITPEWMRATSSSSVGAGRTSNVTIVRVVKPPLPPRAARSFIESTLRSKISLRL